MSMWNHVPLKDVRIKDQYWDRYTKLIPDKALPYQWEILNDRVPDAPPSYCLQNFRIVAGESAAQRAGTIFQDSDAYKWLEAVAYSLAANPDPGLERTADEVIALVGRAQQPDGYLNTYYTVVEPGKRWRNLTGGHELYCAGHLLEAGAAYYQCTGKRNLLDICIRFADLICNVFGPEDSQCHGYPGHPEIELALVKLAKAVGDAKYLDMAKYFIDVRGTVPEYLGAEQARPDYRPVFPEFACFTPEYAQAHKPVREQDTAEGHAVRACYLYSAMADVAAETGDTALLEQCKTIWNNMVRKRMYVTGSIGSSGFFERFTTDYDLPNDSNYSETCASIALAMFGARMAAATRDASYMDVVERALYNTVRAGISLEGNSYLYVNPLEVWPKACMESTSRSHVKAVRQKWFDVACCPTNIARTFTGLGNYMYGVAENSIYVNLYIQHEAVIPLEKQTVKMRCCTDFPRTGNVRFTVDGNGVDPVDLYLRIPEYASNYQVQIDDVIARLSMHHGFFYISRAFNHSVISVRFDITAYFAMGNPLVNANCGKVALLRGPEVYCLEEIDNGSLFGIYVNPGVEVSEEWDETLLGGTVKLSFPGKQLFSLGEASTCHKDQLKWKDRPLTAVPYGSWGNREPGEMITWIHALLPME